jgi:hypothetical protein
MSISRGKKGVITDCHDWQSWSIPLLHAVYSIRTPSFVKGIRDCGPVSL